MEAGAEMKARRGNVEVVAVGPVEHNGVIRHALPRVLAWFEDVAAR